MNKIYIDEKYIDEKYNEINIMKYKNQKIPPQHDDDLCFL